VGIFQVTLLMIINWTGTISRFGAFRDEYLRLAG
jgi:hypothetical protein